MDKIYINDMNLVSPLGCNLDENWHNLLADKTGLQSDVTVGPYKNITASSIDKSILDAYCSENNLNFGTEKIEQMFHLALHPLVEKNKIEEDSILILSTTKGEIDQLKKGTYVAALFENLAHKMAEYYGFKTKPIIVSNACISGVLAVITAKRLLQMKFASTAYVVGIDLLSEFVVSGFNSFQAMDLNSCKPFDVNHAGVNLGEAAAALYLSKSETLDSFEILGACCISDANHISGPSRTADGLYLSIQKALLESGISTDDISSISAHGTATVYNDEMEAMAINRAALSHVPVNSLKGVYGHTLGAAGLVELAIHCCAMKADLFLKTPGFKTLGVPHELAVLTENKTGNNKVLLKLASGFGGSNAAILIQKRTNEL